MGTVTAAPEKKKSTQARPGSSSPQQHRRKTCASPSTWRRAYRTLYRKVHIKLRQLCRRATWK